MCQFGNLTDCLLFQLRHPVDLLLFCGELFNATGHFQVVTFEGAFCRNCFTAGIALFSSEQFFGRCRLWRVIADFTEKADKAHEVETYCFAGGDAVINNILRELLEFFPDFGQADGEVEAVVFVAGIGVVRYFHEDGDACRFSISFGHAAAVIAVDDETEQS